MKIVVFEQEKTCAPCKRLKPQITSVAEKLDISLEFWEVSNNWNLCLEYEVKSTPTVFLMDEDNNVLEEIYERSAVPLLREVRNYVNN